MQVGLLLAYLSGKVLGQYELFLPPKDGQSRDGRLTLVAPNIVAAERQLDVDPRDFRLWVCVHEVTHRTQFTAVRWLRAHLHDEISAFLLASDLDPAAMLGRLRGVGESVRDNMRRRGSTATSDDAEPEGLSFLEAVQNPEQRAILNRLTAVMTLLEGHGEYVMNGVGPSVIPTVEEIGAKFAERRRGQGPADRIVRKLFGLDMKAKQYADGAAFVARCRRTRRDACVQPGLDVTEHACRPRRKSPSRSCGCPGSCARPLESQVSETPVLVTALTDPAPSTPGRRPAGPTAAVAAVRCAVRESLAELAPASLVLVACSGGADSVALAAAAAFEAPRLGLRVGGVTIDHGLQKGSAARAEVVAALLGGLGLQPVEVVAVDVSAHRGGPEAAARAARYGALDVVADRLDAATVLVGHTLDDQAETVLLGLARGSGTRSLAGMAAVGARYRRPLLGVERAVTRAACADLGLPVWDDPQNADAAFARVRVRADLLPLLEAALGPGMAAALARTADLARDDADALDHWAERSYVEVTDADSALDVGALAQLPPAIRRRVLRLAALRAGIPAGSLAAVHLLAIEALVTDWHGQGPVALPGGRTASRRYGKLYLGTDLH